MEYAWTVVLSRAWLTRKYKVWWNDFFLPRKWIILSKPKVKRRTTDARNLMPIIENDRFCSLALGLSLVKFGFLPAPLVMVTLFRIVFRADSKSYPLYYEHLSDMWLSTLEIGAAQLHSVTEIAPNSLVLYVNRSPIRYSFRAGASVIRYGVKITIVSSEFSVAVLLS